MRRPNSLNPLALASLAACAAAPSESGTESHASSDTGQSTRAPADTASTTTGAPDTGGSESDGSTGSASTPVAYPLTELPYSTLQATWAPLTPSAQTLSAIADGALSVYEHEAYAGAGLGVTLSPGQPWQSRNEIAPGFVAGRPQTRTSLAYLWQSADAQIIDEESPIRFSAIPGLYRPHGHLSPQVFESHVRSAARISALSSRPFDFAVVAGDMTDGSQRNELQWMLTVLNGGVIDPDSGIDDDPVPGPGNDYNDPFVSDGLDVPWYAALGNHETLYNGGFGALTDDVREAAVGESLYDSGIFANGFRDGATELGDVVTSGSTPADPDRLPLRRLEVLAALRDAAGSPDGHGLDDADVEAGRGYFASTPIDGRPIRLITLDTVNSETSAIGQGALGVIDGRQFGWLQDQLAQADRNRELVIVVSHHRPDDFAASSAVSGDDLVDALASSAGVVLHLTGHGHRHASVGRAAARPGSAFGYWELMLASTVDFPMHTRIIEIVDEGTGYLSIYVTNLEHNAPEDSLAHHARGLAAGRRSFPQTFTPGDVEALWAEDLPHQNLLLRVPVPESIAENLAAFAWPAQIESESTLLGLPGPQ